MARKKKFEFDIALSFAGEDRARAEELAEGLRALDVRAFYDRYEQAKLWGKDLYQHLQTVYRDKARYCVIFVSKHYAEKVWPRHELKQAQARAFRENIEYILPLRLDDTDLPGLNPTVGYIDLRQHSMSDVKDLLLRKVYGEHSSLAHRPEILKWRGELVAFRGEQVASYWPKLLKKSQRRTTYQVAKTVKRIRYGDEPGFKSFARRYGKEYLKRPCGDCSALPGEVHGPGCDMERCPGCGGQAIGCACLLDYEY
jgi:hypothetical protein